MSATRPAARAFGYTPRVVPFPVTRRSMLERVRSGDSEVRRVAFGDLAEGYWRAGYHYVRLHWRLPPDSAEDAVQGFFATAFEKGYLERYDPSKARFRTFLRVCLDRFVQNQQKSERSLRRGGGATRLSLDFPGAEQEVAALAAADRADPDRFFFEETIRALFARTVDTMRRALETEGRVIVFRVFERHDLASSPDVSYAVVAAELGLSVTQVTNHLHNARRRFRDLALSQLRAISASEDEYRRDARELFGVEVAR